MSPQFSKQAALEIAMAGINAVRPDPIFSQSLRIKDDILVCGKFQIDLSSTERIFIWGAGKAAPSFAQSFVNRIHKIASNINVTGLVLGVGNEEFSENGVTYSGVREEGSNWPTPRAVNKTKQLIEYAAKQSPKTPIIGFLTGGASAILCLPHNKVTLEEKISICQKMHAEGANIHELNFVRGILSQVKGGGLLPYFHQNTHTVVVSDVIGDDPKVIGGAPTIKAPCDGDQLKGLITKFQLDQFMDTKDWLKLANDKQREFTTEERGYEIIASNKHALSQAAMTANEIGYHPTIIDDAVDSDIHSFSLKLIEMIQNAPHRQCYLFGGETTCKLGSKVGKGGRNQELGLRVLAGISPKQWPQGTLVCLGTDGEDGNSQAAGCIISPHEARIFTGQENQIAKAIEEHSSFHFLEGTDAHIMTGLTQTNVMDLYLYVSE